MSTERFTDNEIRDTPLES